jgi:Fungal specific transcription factor domain
MHNFARSTLSNRLMGFAFSKGMLCDYETQQNSQGHRQNSEPIDEYSSNRKNQFPSVFFLDHSVYESGWVRLPIPTTPIPSHIQSLIGDSTQVRDTATIFFNSVHNYLPVVSKKLFYERLINPLQELRADVALLCLCMRLSMWSQMSDETNPQNDVYLAAKRYVMELEALGVLTLALMQSCLLLSIYEIGHGIYPAAYMTVGACASYGFALALNSKGTIYSEQFTWIEKEERRRVWWAIIILERYVCFQALLHVILYLLTVAARIAYLGWPGRPLQTPDPASTDILPADDLPWDQGVDKSEMNCQCTDN